LDEQDRSRFLSFASFGLQVIPIQAAASLWEVDDEVAEKILSRLSSFGLIHIDANRGLIEIHSLIRGYLAKELPNVRPIDLQSLIKRRQLLVALKSDSEDGDDLLDIKPEVDAFGSVLALKDLQPPLCLGIFGDWGTGKTFFMKKLQSRITWLCRKSEGAETDGAETAFCCRVAQITFNAWHYVDANLWASIACRIFEGLDQFISEHSIDPEARKAQLFKQLETAREKLDEAKSATEAAKQELNAAETQLEDLERQRREK